MSHQDKWDYLSPPPRSRQAHPDDRLVRSYETDILSPSDMPFPPRTQLRREDPSLHPIPIPFRPNAPPTTTFLTHLSEPHVVLSDPSSSETRVDSCDITDRGSHPDGEAYHRGDYEGELGYRVNSNPRERSERVEKERPSVSQHILRHEVPPPPPSPASFRDRRDFLQTGERAYRGQYEKGYEHSESRVSDSRNSERREERVYTDDQREHRRMGGYDVPQVYTDERRDARREVEGREMEGGNESRDRDRHTAERDRYSTSHPLDHKPAREDIRLPGRQDASTALAEGLEKLKLTSFVVRPGYGAKGRKIQVLSNHYQVRPTGNRAKIIHHYDVIVEPVVKTVKPKIARQTLRAVWEQLVLEEKRAEWKKAFEAGAFDGRRNCYTPVPFPIEDGQEATLIAAVGLTGQITKPHRDGSTSDEESKRWRIVIRQVAQIDLQRVMEFCKANENTPRDEEQGLTGLMATNILLRDIPSVKYAQVGATGNKFFTLEGARPISQGAVVCKGFMQSFKYSNSGLPVINIDLGFSAFLASGPALEVVAKILGKRDSSEIDQLDESQLSILKRKLRGAKFTLTYRQNPRLHTIVGVTMRPAAEISVDVEGRDEQPGRHLSIIQYYKEYHGLTVTRPRLPCIQYSKRFFVPFEFVEIEDFNSLPPTNLTANQTAEILSMIKHSALRPQARQKQIEEWRRELAYEKQPKFAAWGLQVNNRMLQIDARVLPPPQVKYKFGDARPRDGGWNLRGMQFFRNAKKPLRSWSVLSFDRYVDTSNMQRFINFLVLTLRTHGVVVENAYPPCVGPMAPVNEGAVVQAVKEAARRAWEVEKELPQLICIVLPGKDAWLYETIKRISFTELHRPVPTQCMQGTKIKSPRGIDAYTGNLVMKIQSKLGGVTHHVPPESLPGMVRGETMLLGAELGHPPNNMRGSHGPTVACTIATYNADCDTYSAQIRLQPSEGEIILDLSEMIESHLLLFQSRNEGRLPSRILVFRDGISEGQYAATTAYEHGAILSACTRMKEGYRPKVLICVCIKRHSTRFFGNERDVDRTGNLPSGTVVDRTVTHPYVFDFYLQAHAGLVGTARPTHYVCLLDELAIKPDDLQQLVHSLCYTFSRCTRSVSLVPVCYIADLVCQKARIIVHDPTSTISPSITSGGHSKVSLSAAGTRDGLGISDPSGPSGSGGSGRITSGPGHNSGPGSGSGPRAGPLAGLEGGGTSGTRRSGNPVDAMKIQKILAKNPELSNVMWWM